MANMSFREREFLRRAREEMNNFEQRAVQADTTADAAKSARQTAYEQAVKAYITQADMNASDVAKNKVGESFAYGMQGKEQLQNLANSLISGAGTKPNRGDVKNWDWDAGRKAVLDNESIISALRSIGLYNTMGNATNPQSVHLVSNDYLNSLPETLAAMRAASVQEDEKALANQQQQTTTSNWLQSQYKLLMNNKDNPDPIEQMNDWAYFDWLSGDRAESFDAYNARLNGMTEEEYLAWEQRVKDQHANADWEALTNAQYRNYESKTPMYDEWIKTVQGEIDKRAKIAELEALAKSNPQYDLLSVYEYGGVVPERLASGDSTEEEAKAAGEYLQSLRNQQFFINVRAADEIEDFYTGYAGGDATAWRGSGYGYLTPDEIAVYNVLYNTDQQKAQEYLQALQSDLFRRMADVQAMEDAVFAQNGVTAFPTWLESVASGLVTPFATLAQGVSAATGTDDPNSPLFYFNRAQQNIRDAQEEVLGELNAPEILGKNLYQWGYGGASSAADNAARLMFGGAGSLAAAGLQSASGSLYENADRDDMEGSAKIVQALLTGSLEVGTEKIGLDSLFDMGQDSALKYLVKAIGSELGEESVNYFGEYGVELAVAWLFGHEAEIRSAEELAMGYGETVLNTLISSGIMSGPGAVETSKNVRGAGKNARLNGDINALVEIGLEMPTDSKSNQIARELNYKQGNGKAYSNYDLGRLTMALEEETSAELAEAPNKVMDEVIAEHMMEMGVDEKTAKYNAPFVRKLSRGQKLTAKEKDDFRYSGMVDQVVKDYARGMASGKKASGWLGILEEQTNSAVDKAASKYTAAAKAAGKIKEEAGERITAKPEGAVNANKTETTAVEKTAAKAAEKAAAKVKAKKSGKESNKSVISVAYDDGTGKASGEASRFVEKDGGLKLEVKTADGTKVVDVADVTEASGEGIAAVAAYVEEANNNAEGTHRMSAHEANTMLRVYQTEKGDAGKFIAAFENAYLAGYSGIALNKGGLSEQAASIAYEQGKAEAKADEQNRVQRVSKARKSSKGSVHWIGMVDSNEQVYDAADAMSLEEAAKDMTQSQRTVVDVVRAFAERFKVNVKLFESSAENIGGIQNGSFDQNTNTLYVDVNAGANTAEDIGTQRKYGTLGYAMVRAFTHELTHYLEANSSEAYANYKTAVKNELANNGQDWAVLVRSKIDTARMNGRKMTYGEAEAEIVADASEYMLENSRFAQSMDGETKGIVKQMVQNFIQKLRDVFSKLTSGHRESAALRKTIDGVMKYTGNLQQLWDAAMDEVLGNDRVKVTTSQNTQTVEKTAIEKTEKPRFDAALEDTEDTMLDETLKETTESDVMQEALKGEVSEQEYAEEQKAKPRFEGELDDVDAALDETLRETTEADVMQEALEGEVTEQEVSFTEMLRRAREEAGITEEDVNRWRSEAQAEETQKTVQPTKKKGFFGKKAAKNQNLQFSERMADEAYSENTAANEQDVQYTAAEAAEAKTTKTRPRFTRIEEKSGFEEEPEYEIAEATEGKTKKNRGKFVEINEKSGFEENEGYGAAKDASEKTTNTGNGGTFGPKTPDTRYSRRADEIQETMAGAIDTQTESATPQYSIRTWAESDYVTQRDEAARRLAKSLQVSVAKAQKWIDDVNSISAYVLNNKARLDYIPTAVKGMSAFKSNPEYGGSIDMSTICAKRRLATGTLDAIQRVLGDAVLTKDDFLHIREIMKDRGYEVACGLCFVESSRKNLSKYNRQFLDQYRAEHPDVELDMVDLNTVEGLEKLRSNTDTADIYAAYEKFMNKLAQRKPKLFEKRTEYNHEILNKFKSDTSVGVKNTNGGLRLQSFSDFEIVHLLDMMQVITDMASVGLAGQAYTKVPDFAWALGDTGLKINLSLIAKDVDADGNLIFDDIEGMNHKEAKRLRDAYSKNVGTIVVTFTDEQTIAAMKSDFIDYIIPFHRSQWQKGDYKKLGLPEGTKDYTLHQNEKEGRKRVKENFLPNAYWDFSVSGKQNAINYLKMCAEAGRTPKFAKFLENNGDGTYSLKADGSTDGYWKLLIDFKMYDNDGNGSPQLAVKPIFNMDQAMRMLKDYNGEHDTFPVAQDVVDDFVKEYRGDKGGVKSEDGRYTVNPVQHSFRDAPAEMTTREFLTESDDSIADTVEERNALSIYKQLLLKHADASDKVIAAERVLEAADEDDKAEARKALTAARAKQKELYNRLLNVERTAHVQTVVKRSQQIISDLYGKNQAEMDKIVSALERKVESLRLDLQALKGAAKTQREADIRAAERNLAAYKSKAVQTLLENNEKHTQRMKALHERVKLNAEIAKLQRHIKRIVKRLDDRIRHESDYKNIKEEMKPAVHALVKTFVDEFGDLVFTNPSDAAVAGGKQSTLKARARFERLKMVYDKLADIDGVEHPSYDRDVSAWLQELHELAGKYSGLETETNTTSRLNQKLYIYTRLADISDNIATMVKTADTMFIDGRKQAVSDLANETAVSLGSKKDHKLRPGKTGEILNRLDDLLLHGNMNSVTYFETLGNSGLSRLYRGITDGERISAQRLREGREFVADSMKRHGYLTWGNMRKPVEFKTEQGHTVYLTTGALLSVYATAKRERSNELTQTHHLDEGGFSYDEKHRKFKEVADNGANDHHRLSAKDIVAIEAMLTDDQKAFADECVEFMSTECADWGNEASRIMFGIDKYTEDYYFPITVDSGQLHKNSAAGSSSTTDDARLKHSPFTHAVSYNANKPIVIGDFLDIVDNHINQMAIYSSFVVPIENMSRVLNSRVEYNDEKVTIRSLIERKYGKASEKYLADFLKDMNGGPQTDRRGENNFIRFFKKSAVMGKLQVALQQCSSIARAFPYINARYFVSVPKETPNTIWNRMLKHSGTAVYKDIGGFNVGMGQHAADWVGQGALEEYWYFKRGKFLLDQKGVAAMKDNWVDFLTALPGVMDKVTWTTIWTAVENEQSHKHPEMDRASDEFQDMVGRRFDDIIRHTQVYDSVLTKSQNMRSKSSLTKMTTAFMAEPTQTLNMFYSAIKSGDKNLVRKSVNGILLSQVLGALGYALIASWDKDDDERTATEKFVVKFSGKLADSVNPLTWIPLVSDLWSLLNGYDVERTDVAVFADLIQYGEKFFDKLEKGEALSFRDYEKFIGTAVMTVTGIPLQNFMGDFRRLALNLPQTDFSAPPASRVKYGILDEVVLGRETSNKAYYERYLAALKDGDKQEQYDLKDYLTATKKVKEETFIEGVRNAYKAEYQRGGIEKQTAIDFLVDNGLAKDQKSAFEYVDRWEEGGENPSPYKSIREHIWRNDFAAVNEEIRELEANGWTPQQIYNALREDVDEHYMLGNMTQAQYKAWYNSHGVAAGKPQRDDNDWYWEFKRLDWGKAHGGSDEGYNAYEDLYKAVEAGGSGLSKTIKEYQKYGKTREDLNGKLNSYYKPLLIEAKKSGRGFADLQAKVLTAYQLLGYDRQQKLKTIQNWLTEAN